MQMALTSPEVLSEAAGGDGTRANGWGGGRVRLAMHDVLQPLDWRQCWPLSSLSSTSVSSFEQSLAVVGVHTERCRFWPVVIGRCSLMCRWRVKRLTMMNVELWIADRSASAIEASFGIDARTCRPESSDHPC
jgi:hypothetical protein